MARWTRAERALLALLWVVASGGAGGEETAPGTLRFARHGEPVASRTLDALRASAADTTITVFEPYEGREVSFRALRLDAVLDAVYSPSWREEEELLFTCRDGYQPTVPVRRVLVHEAWLAFARRDDAFAIWKRESGRRQRVALAPFYLIWENLDDAVVRREGDYGWPYQLVGIDLIRAGDRFPRMQPPADAGPAVREGFTAFRMYCSRCHPLHGEGGAIGPELATAGLRDPAWLRRWIDDPSRILANARMPALDPELPGRTRILDALVAYLAAMAEEEPTDDG